MFTRWLVQPLRPRPTPTAAQLSYSTPSSPATTAVPVLACAQCRGTVESSPMAKLLRLLPHCRQSDVVVAYIHLLLAPALMVAHPTLFSPGPPLLLPVHPSPALPTPP